MIDNKRVMANLSISKDFVSLSHDGHIGIKFLIDVQITS